MWAPVMDRWHDQTGVAHYLVDRNGVATPLCGARPYTLGGGYPSAEASGSRECKTCALGIKNGSHLRG